jgi:hypothetical protein
MQERYVRAQDTVSCAHTALYSEQTAATHLTFNKQIWRLCVCLGSVNGRQTDRHYLTSVLGSHDLSCNTNNTNFSYFQTMKSIFVSHATEML